MVISLQGAPQVLVKSGRIKSATQATNLLNSCHVLKQAFNFSFLLQIGLIRRLLDMIQPHSGPAEARWKEAQRWANAILSWITHSLVSLYVTELPGLTRGSLLS